MSEPDIKILDNFLTLAECEYLIDKYKDQVTKSTVIEDNHSKAGYLHNSRTSSTFFTSDDDNIIKAIKKRAADYVKLPVSHLEGIQFLRYKQGEKYEFHYDGFSKPENGIQRIHTLLVYLNDLSFEDGGSTTFWQYKVKVFPKTGRAVWFRNANDEGTKREDNSMHSGDPILKDVTKYALNIWIRNKPF